MGLFLVALLLFGVDGCASTRRLTSEVDDYERFRRIRLARGVEQRLRAGWVYLHNHPHGAFRSEVEPWFHKLEERYLGNAWDHPERLRSYLGVLPNGPRAGLVEARLRQLERAEVERRRREQEFLAAQKEREERLAAAKLARGRFIRTVSEWLRLLARFDGYRQPVEQWDAAFKGRFFEEAPKGFCEARVCKKTFSFEFDVPDARGLVTRRGGFSVVLHLDDRRLVAADVTAPALFSRLGEAASADAVSEGDLQSRVEAIGTSAQIIGLALDVSMPRDRCQKPLISPTIALRRCRGMQAEAVIGEDGEQTDRVRFMPTQAPVDSSSATDS